MLSAEGRNKGMIEGRGEVKNVFTFDVSVQDVLSVKFVHAKQYGMNDSFRLGSVESNVAH